MDLSRLVITCGGTGGHFFPGLSIAREFHRQGGKVMLLLSGVHAETQKQIAESFGITAKALPKMPNQKKFPVKFLLGAVTGFFSACASLRRFKPQAVLGMGSFATIPVIIAATICRIPVFLHDGNARIGRANRFFSRFAKKLGTGFPAVNASACCCDVSVTGMPVRPELRQWAEISRTEALQTINARFGTDFSPDIPVILITGGSQGASVFNTVMPQVLTKRREKLQVIHLTGKNKMDETTRAYGDDTVLPRLLLESCSEMELCLGSADLIFSRSGGSTAAEIALFGKAALFVPYPYAAEDHQSDNARYFCDAGGAEMVSNSDFTPEKITSLLDDFFAYPEKWQQRCNIMKQLAIPDAAEKMLHEISAATD